VCVHSCAALAEFIAPSHLPGFHKLDAAQQTRVEDAFKVTADEVAEYEAALGIQASLGEPREDAKPGTKRLWGPSLAPPAAKKTKNTKAAAEPKAEHKAPKKSMAPTAKAKAKAKPASGSPELDSSLGSKQMPPLRLEKSTPRPPKARCPPAEDENIPNANLPQLREAHKAKKLPAPWDGDEAGAAIYDSIAIETELMSD